jgi:hypothetical protein
MTTRAKIVRLNLNLNAKYRVAFERLSRSNRHKLQLWMESWLESAVVSLSTEKFPS